MATYATVDDVRTRLNRELDSGETAVCEALLEDAALLIDQFALNASEGAKKLVSCRMVIRAIGSVNIDVPIGASQASQSALGYTQSWTLSGGSAGELYLSKTDKQLLGGGNMIGAVSPLEGMV